MCSLKKHLKSSTKMAVVVTSFHVQLLDAKDVTAVMSFGSLTKAMRTRPAIFYVMRRYAGVLKQWRQLMLPGILMLHAMYWRRRRCGTGQSWLNSNGFPKTRWPIDILSTQQVRQGTYCFIFSFKFSLIFSQLCPRAEIVRWVAESKRPDKIVKDRGFQLLMKTGRPGYHIPSPETVSRDVKMVFVNVRKRIAKMLQVVPIFSHWQ